jgi:hypothetical protein
MSNILIIAPTHGYKRSPDQVLKNDTIKDYTDFTIVHEKIESRVPVSARKAPGNTVFKQYQDMRMIHSGSQRADERARALWIEREATKKKNGVSFPNTQETNERYVKGINI